jgi:hypothetical protein
MAGVQFPAGAIDFPVLRSVQTGSAAHPASSAMGARGEASGSSSWLLTSGCELKNGAIPLLPPCVFIAFKKCNYWKTYMAGICKAGHHMYAVPDWCWVMLGELLWMCPAPFCHCLEVHMLHNEHFRYWHNRCCKFASKVIYCTLYTGITDISIKLCIFCAYGRLTLFCCQSVAFLAETYTSSWACVYRIFRIPVLQTSVISWNARMYIVSHL